MSVTRWILRLKVSMFRAFMALGMKLHNSADPKPLRPNFNIVIPSRLSTKVGQFKLVFYVPEGYFQSSEEGHRYPVVVNFHGGGFALGTGTDDARWASSVVKYVNAVFVSVEYRLAPEYPFSVGLEDGSDAIIYLAAHAKELKLDSHRISLSGFSAGGNLAFAIPLVLWELKNNIGKRYLKDHNQPKQLQNYQPSTTPKSFSSAGKAVYNFNELEVTELEVNQKLPDFNLQCIVSFYPPIDFRQPRAEKMATNRKPEKNLPAFLTKLFDESLMFPRENVDVADPHLSPAAASNDLLQAAYPNEIVLYTCEFDMLNAEGVAFGERLSSASVGKNVRGTVIKDVAHGFDKMPNPKKFSTTTDKCYNEACAILKEVFDEVQLYKGATVDIPQIHAVQDGMTDERSSDLHN